MLSGVCEIELLAASLLAKGNSHSTHPRIPGFSSMISRMAASPAFRCRYLELADGIVTLLLGSIGCWVRLHGWVASELSRKQDGRD